MLETNTTEVNQRLIDNEVYCHSQLAPQIRQILSITPNQLAIENISAIPGKWLVNGSEIVGELTGFNGIIDLETTGLEYDSTIICAVGIGFIGGEFVVATIGQCDKLPIQHSTILNINQPFDRSLYDIQNGKDTCRHIDLSSMAKIVHGTPAYSKYGFNGYVSMKGLADFYFGEEVDKTDRDLLTQGILSFEDTVRYCLRDVVMTVRLAQRIIPDYVEKNPSPISMYGLSSRAFSIPLSDKFDGFYDRCQKWYENQLELLQVELEKAAINALTDATMDYFFDEYPETYATEKGLLKAISDVDSELATKMREQAKDNPRARNKCIVKICKREASFSSSWIALIVKARYRGEL